MKKILFILLTFSACQVPQSNDNELPKLSFETSNGKETATYEETILFYQALAQLRPNISIEERGMTDAGKPLHLVKYTSSNTTLESIRILINNGIHPGESDGIDASMMLFRDLVNGKYEIPENIAIYCIPFYNIGGALNRNSTSRVNQNGPLEYGFRGNALNYDLNRDFIKSDTKNARSFASIFHEVDPHVFIDTHVSNGADYTYTLTHLYTQAQKLGSNLGNFFVDTFQPSVEQNLLQKNWEMTPYVNVFNKPPDLGFNQFLDTPRYSTGYTSLWNSMGVMIETHMLKDYPQRVKATRAMLEGIIEETHKHAEEIISLRREAFSHFANLKSYPIQFTLDSSSVTPLNFKGFEAGYKKSEVTGHQRLYYNQDKKFEKIIPYYATYKSSKEVNIPKAYYIPPAYEKIVDLLKLNQIEVRSLTKDSIVEAENYRIASYETYKQPYEGHYPHYNTQVIAKKAKTIIARGGYIISTHQRALRYIIDTLDPEAPDSFFNWNFFDAILQQKEGFSPYVIDEIALDILTKDKELEKAFKEKKNSDKDFEANAYEQLYWIFKNSPYYEEAHLNYPVLRLF